MVANAINIRKLELDELLVTKMGIIRKVPIFPDQIFGIAKYVIQ